MAYLLHQKKSVMSRILLPKRWGMSQMNASRIGRGVMTHRQSWVMSHTRIRDPYEEGSAQKWGMTYSCVTLLISDCEEGCTWKRVMSHRAMQRDVTHKWVSSRTCTSSLWRGVYTKMRGDVFRFYMTHVWSWRGMYTHMRKDALMCDMTHLGIWRGIYIKWVMSHSCIHESYPIFLMCDMTHLWLWRGIHIKMSHVTSLWKGTYTRMSHVTQQRVMMDTEYMYI